MNTVSRRTLYIILAYLVVAVGLTVIGLKKQYKSMESEPRHNREAGKHSSELKSYEHFYV